MIYLVSSFSDFFGLSIFYMFLVILFQDNSDQTIDLASFNSQFNQIFIIVQKHGVMDGELMYRVRVATKADVTPFPPFLNSRGNLIPSHAIKKWVLSKGF